MLIVLASLSCKKDKETASPSDPTPTVEELFVGKYDGTESITYLYPSGTYPANSRARVAEITLKSGSEYNYYIDGYWQGTIIIDRIYDGIIYFNLKSNSGYFSTSNEFYDFDGAHYIDADFSSVHGSFNTKINNKFQICCRYYNIKNATTGEERGFEIITFFDGYKR